jgi:hypothetical protein
MKLFLLSLLIGLTTTARSAQAPASLDATDELQTSNLKGLKALGVVVALGSDLETSGLSEGDIKADTEGRLKESGIRVLTGKERLQAPGRPYLYIAIGSACKENVCAVEVGVRVIEAVRLQRDSMIETNAAVWRRDMVRIIERSDLRNMRSVVTEFVETFKAAIQVANH